MLQFGVLGPLTVERGGFALALPSGRARLLLGALIVGPGAAVSMDELVDRLWGEAPPRTAVTALHGHVSRLRKMLGDEILLTTPRGYRLGVDPDQVDSGRFRRMVAEAQRVKVASARSNLLREALGLWRGPALADFCYEPFAQADIAALEEMRLTAIEDAVEADLTMGRHGTLVADLQGLVRQHPLRERLCGQLMIALYRCERQAEALSEYRNARTRMVDELGVEPGPALREIEAAILRQEPALAAPTLLQEFTRTRADDPMIRRVDRADAEFIGRTAEHLVGREDEVGAIVRFLSAPDRLPGVAVLPGEAGIGKTALWLAGVNVAADRGYRILSS